MVRWRPTSKLCFHFLSIIILTASATFGDGSLTVKTDPENIEVWLGDRFIGQSPIIDKKIKSGRYTLKLIDPAQHTSQTEELFIEDNQNTVVERTLASKFGTLKVASEPEGAEVYIATELGKTPLTNNFMNPGKYQIEIRGPTKRFSTTVKDIVIPQGESVSITTKLDKSKFLTTRTFLSLGLTAGAIAGYSWAIVEQGNYSLNKERKNQNKADAGALNRTLGVVAGTVCVIGLELVVLFY